MAYINLDQSTNAFRCALCGSTFPSNAALVSHKAVHSDERRIFTCKCSMPFTDHCEFLLHEVTHMHHKEARQCIECGELKPKISFPIHILTHFKQRSEKCDMCGVVLSYDKMKSHAKTHSDFKKQFKCTVCQRILSESKRTQHMLNHTKARKTYPCDYCGKVYLHKDSQTSHLNMHLGIKNEICELCGFRSHSAKNILHHKKKHSTQLLNRSIAKFECDYCKKTILDRSQFVRHVRKHGRI